MEAYTQIEILPVLPMRAQVVFPDATVSFDVGRNISLAALESAGERGDSRLFITRQRSSDEIPAPADLYDVGTVAAVRQTVRLGNRTRITVEGLYRACAEQFSARDGSVYAYTRALAPERGSAEEEEAGLHVAKALFSELGKGDQRQRDAVLSVSDADLFVNLCAQQSGINDVFKQKILEEVFVPARLRLLAEGLASEAEIAALEQKIAQEVRKNIEKSQKEYYLREQLKAIHGELGDDAEEGDKLRARITEKHLPAETEEKAMAEVSRMERMAASSPEYTVIRNYLDWLLDLPWTEKTEDTESLADVEAMLEEDHYGLEKIKERVLEYLAVLKLTGTLKAPILCLVGPPGVGKTSIAKSIARALGRKFVRMSLGGLKDEAEIRGHRRTYIGSMPGRIIYEMKSAGVVNPVFLLDEVDKISSDLRGDPSSALLEVLDPEQNFSFRDRYLEVPYDLSNVMFIATANTLDTIPMPLRDRMEIIELTGYTPQEKEEIAVRYLVPKKCAECGLKEERIRFTRGAILAIIEGYTMEAGVRSLERHIGSVCRKAAVRIAKGEGEDCITVTGRNLESFLGAKRYLRGETISDRDEVGAATGLAWTAVGGTTLSIEVSVLQGKGEILLTGKLGDVMKESARAALSYIRANADRYGVDGAEFEGKDIHIHVPEGATPKDGPSAGITMATAILSAFTGKPVRRDVAMTGEITLRGKVLPIGGLKEKALAAHRAGIRNVIIPAENKKDAEEIPEPVRKQINFICVSEADEVFRNAIVGGIHGI